MHFKAIFATILCLTMLGTATDIAYTFTATAGEGGTLASSMTMGSVTTQAFGTGKQVETISAASSSGNTSVDWTYNLAGGDEFDPSNFASYRIRNADATYRGSSWGTGMLNTHVSGITSNDDALAVDGTWEGAYGSVTESYHTSKGMTPKADRYVNIANWKGEFKMASRLTIDPQHILPGEPENWLPACTSEWNPVTGMSNSAAVPVQEPSVIKVSGETNPWLIASAHQGGPPLAA